MRRAESIAEPEVRGVASDEELHLANDLMSKVHSRDYYDVLHWMEHCGLRYPNFAREHTRIATLNGEIAGALRITTDTIRIGEARLKMGGFGWVTTSGRHRHKGIARMLMEHTLAYLREHSYHVTMLFGIPNFYHRFGFTTTLAEYTTSIDVLEAETAPRGELRRRAGKPGDIPAMLKLHNAHEEEVACSLVRVRSHVANRWDLWKDVQVLTDAQGKVVAYFLPRERDQALSVEEIGVADWEACGPLLNACARMAARRYLPQIHFAAPPGHPFVHYLLQFQSRHETRIQRNRGGMMAFVDLGETLESLIPEWERRLLESSVADTQTELSLLVNGGRGYRLRARHGVMDVAPGMGPNKLSLSPQDLMHLVTGYREVEDVLQQERRILTADARMLLHAIFPRRCPYVWLPDRF